MYLAAAYAAGRRTARTITVRAVLLAKESVLLHFNEFMYFVTIRTPYIQKVQTGRELADIQSCFSILDILMQYCLSCLAKDSAAGY